MIEDVPVCCHCCGEPITRNGTQVLTTFTATHFEKYDICDVCWRCPGGIYERICAIKTRHVSKGQ